MSIIDKLKGDLRDIKQKKFPVIIEGKKYFVAYNYKILSEMAEEFCNGGSADDVFKFALDKITVEQEISVIKWGLVKHYGQEKAAELAEKVDSFEAVMIFKMALASVFRPPEVLETVFVEEVLKKKMMSLMSPSGQEISQ
jgi:hypothetical protein